MKHSVLILIWSILFWFVFSLTYFIKDFGNKHGPEPKKYSFKWFFEWFILAPPVMSILFLLIVFPRWARNQLDTL